MVEGLPQSHPYVPRDLKLPGYVPVVLSQSTIVGVYLLSSLIVVSVIWIISGMLYFIPIIFSALEHLNVKTDFNWWLLDDSGQERYIYGLVVQKNFKSCMLE